MAELLIIAFVFIGLGANAQNLVINPGFEEMLIPDYDAKYWGTFYGYFNTHHFVEEMRVPNVNDSVKGTPFGDGFVAFSPFFYDTFQHMEDEYLEGFLTDSLIVGHKYKLSFYYCSSGYEALDLKILDAYISNDGWFEMLNRRDRPYPTITFNLINNGVWNKAESTFVAQNSGNRIALGIFKHDNMTYEDLYIKYHKCGYNIKRLLSFFTNTQCLFYPKPYDANSTGRSFYMDSTGKVVLYEEFVKKNKSQRLGYSLIKLGYSLIEDRHVWPLYFIDNIELYDITDGGE